MLSSPLQLILTLYAMIQALLLTEHNFFWYFDAGLKHIVVTEQILIG